MRTRTYDIIVVLVVGEERRGDVCDVVMGRISGGLHDDVMERVQEAEVVEGRERTTGDGDSGRGDLKSSGNSSDKPPRHFLLLCKEKPRE